MKLRELLETIFSKDPYDMIDFGSADLERFQSRISDTTLKKKISKNAEIHFVNHAGKFWILTVNRIPVAFLELGMRYKIGDSYYHSIELIYSLESFRKTVILGKFFIELRKLLEHPLMIGAGKTGGLVFPAGFELIKSLAKSNYFTLYSLNLKTGELNDFDPNEDLKTSHGKTIVFK